MLYVERYYYNFDGSGQDQFISETNFVVNYILTDFNQPRKFIRSDNLFDIMQYDSSTFGNNIFVVSCDYDHRTFEQVRTLIRAIRPKIVVLLNDEVGGDLFAEYNTLADDCTLLVRQYRHIDQTYRPNTIFMPTGTSNWRALKREDGEFNKMWHEAHISPKKPATERKLHWTFIGYYDRKRTRPQDLDRLEIIKIMQELPRGIWGRSKDVKETIEFYKDSVFIPNFGGHFHPPTHRPYDAAMAGAIPVVVCTPEEREINFWGHSDAPWVWATDWVSAREEMRRLLNSPEELLQKQAAVEQWWHSYLQEFRDIIKRAMTDNNFSM